MPWNGQVEFDAMFIVLCMSNNRKVYSTVNASQH